MQNDENNEIQELIRKEMSSIWAWVSRCTDDLQQQITRNQKGNAKTEIRHIESKTLHLENSVNSLKFQLLQIS